MLNFYKLMEFTKSKHLTIRELEDLPTDTLLNFIIPSTGVDVDDIVGQITLKPRYNSPGRIIPIEIVSSNNPLKAHGGGPLTKLLLNWVIKDSTFFVISPRGFYLTLDYKDLNRAFALFPSSFNLKVGNNSNITHSKD